MNTGYNDAILAKRLIRFVDTYKLHRIYQRFYKDKTEYCGEFSEKFGRL